MIIGYFVVAFLSQCDEPYGGGGCVSIGNGAEWGLLTALTRLPADHGNGPKVADHDSVNEPTGRDTVGDVSSHRSRAAVAAKFSIVSHASEVGDRCEHSVAVDRAGRVRRVVSLPDTNIEVTVWGAASPPTTTDLATLLVTGCTHEGYDVCLRMLSLVAHGLLPLGDHLWKSEIPDAVLDARLSFGSRTSYRAEIRKDVLVALRNHPSLFWAEQIQKPGTDENGEFVRQIADALELDPGWLVETLRTARDGSDVRFAEVVADRVPSAAKDRLAVEHPDGDRPSVLYWDDFGGGDFSLVPEGWEEENIAPLHELTKASTWGQVRALDLPWWLERRVVDFGEDEEGDPPADEDPFAVTDLRLDFGEMIESMVVPWDFEILTEWFPEWDMDIIYRHCAVGGASPGGHIDTYTPRDTEALLAALRARGYKVEPRGFLGDLEDALYLLCAERQ